MITFNADEIFEIAEQIERNGVKFYTKAASATENDRHKKVLAGLAQMEADHEKTFAAMRAELTRAEKATTTFDPDDEEALYLRAWADGVLFDFNSDPSEAITPGQPITEIFRKAIDLEKDSILFYLGMKKMVPQMKGKDRVDAIIEQEMSHIGTINRQLADIC